MVAGLEHPDRQVRIAMVGKYVDLTESYKSLSEALVHAGIHTRTKVDIAYIDSEEIETTGTGCLRGMDAILVPGGFGKRGIEGKIQAARFARENDIPYLGICLGMQVAVIEYARHKAGLDRRCRVGLRLLFLGLDGSGARRRLLGFLAAYRRSAGLRLDAATARREPGARMTAEPFLTRALARRPGKNFAQGLTTANLGEPCCETMLRQHAAYVRALERLGLEVTVLEPLADYPDSCFVEDVAVVTPEAAVVARPGAPSRQGETGAIEPLLAQYRKTQRIHPPATLDGGDVLVVGKEVFIGISERTNRHGAQQLGSRWNFAPG